MYYYILYLSLPIIIKAYAFNFKDKKESNFICVQKYSCFGKTLKIFVCSNIIFLVGLNVLCKMIDTMLPTCPQCSGWRHIPRKLNVRVWSIDTVRFEPFNSSLGEYKTYFTCPHNISVPQCHWRLYSMELSHMSTQHSSSTSQWL